VKSTKPSAVPCDLHRHQHSLKNHTIASGARFHALENLLTEVANLHGRETARQTRTVLTKYLLTKLTRDELIQGNPIAGVSLDELTGTKKTARSRGGKALSASEYEALVDHLLRLDPAEGIMRRQGRWTLDHLIAKRRNAIDQALLQAATGLRSTEANLITWEHLADDGTTMSVRVTENIAKGGVPRTALVLDDRVAEHLRTRKKSAGSPSEFVIGAPSDPSIAWDRRNRNKAAQTLYLELAQALKIEALENERSHVWRTTLHTLYGDGVSTAVLDSQFGNSEQIRTKHYTDPSDLSTLKKAAEKMRSE
jgi:integrase